MKIKRLAAFILPCLLLVACSKSNPIDPYDNRSAEDIYTTGQKALSRGDYETAIKAFQGLEAHYPFGKYTQQAQLDIIYAHYRFDEQAAATFAADRFIRLYPRFPQLDYVYYMKGLAKFNENTTLLERIMPIDPRKRDVSSERMAFLLFADLLRKYPDSQYAPDARARMIYLRNSLARHEFYAAQYLFNRNAYLGAINRLQGIIQEYDRATVLPEAMHLLVQSYQEMGLTDLAAETEQVLTLNYPSYTQS